MAGFTTGPSKKSTAPGGGGRFENCVAAQRKKGVKKPEALCAAIGRQKYGKGKFQDMARKGK